MASQTNSEMSRKLCAASRDVTTKSLDSLHIQARNLNTVVFSGAAARLA